MNGRSCDKCGGNSFYTTATSVVCRYCNTEYPFYATQNHEGAMGIGVKNDVMILLQKCKADPRNSRRYANLILDIDPTNAEAKRYL